MSTNVAFCCLSKLDIVYFLKKERRPIMQDFFRYFFGQGTEPEFALFTPAHIIPILLLFVALFLLYRYRDFIRNSPYETNYCYILGFMLIICDMSYYW